MSHRSHLSAPSFYDNNPGDGSYTTTRHAPPPTTPQRVTRSNAPPSSSSSSTSSYINTPTRMNGHVASSVGGSDTTSIFDDINGTSTVGDHSAYDHFPVTPIRPSPHSSIHYENGRVPVTPSHSSNNTTGISSTTTTPAGPTFERMNRGTTTTPSTHIPQSPSTTRRPQPQQSQQQQSMFATGMEYRDNFAQDGNAMSDQLKRSAFRTRQNDQPQQQSQPPPPQQSYQSQPTREYQPTPFVDEVDQKQQQSYISPNTSPSPPITTTKDYLLGLEKQLDFVTKQLEREKAKNRELQLSQHYSTMTMNGGGEYYPPTTHQTSPPPHTQQQQQQQQQQPKYFNQLPQQQQDNDIMEEFDELNLIRKQLDDTVEKLYKEKEKCVEKELINTDLRKQIDAIEREKLELQKSGLALKTHNTVIEGRLKERDAELLSLRSIKDAKIHLEREVAMLKDENANLMKELNDMSIGFTATVSEKQRGEEALRKEIEQLKDDNLKLTRNYHSLREDFDNQQRLLQYYQDKDQETKEDIVRLQTDYRGFKTDHDLLKRKNEEYLRQLRQKTAQLDEYHSELDQIKKQLNEKDQHIESLAKSEKELNARLELIEDRSRKQIQKLNGDLEKQKEQNKQDTQSYQAKLTLFESNMKNVNSRAQQIINEKDSQLNDYKDKLLKAERQLDAFKRQFGSSGIGSSINTSSGSGSGIGNPLTSSSLRTASSPTTTHHRHPSQPQPNTQQQPPSQPTNPQHFSSSTSTPQRTPMVGGGGGGGSVGR